MYQYADHEYFIQSFSGRGEVDHDRSQGGGIKRLQWIPHLMIPVVTDPKKAAGALNWAVAEMTRRYQAFAEYHVRDMKGYNEKVRVMPAGEDGQTPALMPQIVIIVDELADLMMVRPETWRRPSAGLPSLRVPQASIWYWQPRDLPLT